MLPSNAEEEAETTEGEGLALLALLAVLMAPFWRGSKNSAKTAPLTNRCQYLLQKL